MSQLIEKVAKAIYNTHILIDVNDELVVWEKLEKYQQQHPELRYKVSLKLHCLNAAKAAIEAMRELPLEVLSLVETGSINYTKEEIWNMFIDAILKSK